MAIAARNDGGPIEYVVSAEADLASIVNPRSGQFALALAEGTIHYHTGTAWTSIAGGSGGAPDDATYLTATSNGDLSAEVVVGATPGGELGGTWGTPTVDATHSGSTHAATQAAAEATAATALSTHEADTTSIHGITDTAALAPNTPDYLVGTAQSGLSAEIVVGTAPGGELGNTWASPTVDATHSGSSHAGVVTAHEGAADPHTGYRKESDDHTHASSGAQAGQIQHADLAGLTDDTHPDYISQADVAGKGDLFAGTGVGTADILTPVGANDTILMADSGQSTGLKWQVPAGTGEIADVADTEAAGTSDTWARGDHVHSAAAYLKEADFDDVDFLVGTATGHTGAEIVVGTAPGGELGGTWATPTVDATHSGSTHGAATTTHEAASDPHTGYLKEADIAAKGDLFAGTADNTVGILTAGANDRILMADSGETSGLKWVASAAPAAVGTAAAEGTSDDFSRASHVHAHEAAHINHDTLWAAKGDIVVATANDTAAVVGVGTEHLAELVPDTAVASGVSWTRKRSALRPTGSLFTTIERNVSVINVTAALVSQRVQLVAIELPAGVTITSISFLSATTAGATLVNQVFGLYNSSLALLRSTVDDTSTAWGANTLKTLALTSTFLTTYHGLHYLAILVNATTVPTLVGHDANTQMYAQAPIVCGTSDTTVTALQNPAAALTANGKFPFAYVS